MAQHIYFIVLGTMAAASWTIGACGDGGSGGSGGDATTTSTASGLGGDSAQGGYCAKECATADDCTLGGVLTDLDCLTINKTNTCREICAGDGDCTMPGKCTGKDDNGKTYCIVESTGDGCTNDDHCKGLGKCEEKACTCYMDADCTAAGVDKCVKP